MTMKKLKKQAILAFIFALIALVVLSASTFAWFTFRAETNVTPMSGTISNGDGDLLISNNAAGPFDTSCELLLADADAELLPLSTADLENFYAVSAQNTSGIATAYREAQERAENNTLRGTVYLRAEGSGFDVYFWQPSIHCGNDDQALAAMRLGLKITTMSGTVSHIFRLDELGNTANAESRITIPQPGCVVGSVDADGNAAYVEDGAIDISMCAAGGDQDNVLPGNLALCTLSDGEVATVEFMLYLEGCDENCINSVQARDIGLQFAFAGAQND